MGFAVGLVIGLVVGAAATWLFLVRPSGNGVATSKALLDARVVAMTPEEFVSRCGPALKDNLSSSPLDVTLPGQKPNLDERDVTVEVTLPSGERRQVAAEFIKIGKRGEKPQWRLYSVGGYDAALGPLGGVRQIEELYPCTTKP